jgi:serine/threonine protein kinase
MIEAGQLLQDRYRIDRQIGQGGMGAVYVATDERFNSTVAIKETLCMDDNYRRAIEREARLLNSLKHNALPRVTDHFLESEGQFLVMEYIPGEDLACQLEEREDPFPIDEILDWADQLLEALDFLHNQENPVVHRDIKPQNLKVTAKGRIILLDFGLAKGNVTGAGNQTNAKSIFGYSRNYASLEQIQGTGTDPRSDLYSLAATLYHLLTKVAPEDALTRAMSVLGQKPDPLVPANQIKPEIPAGVAAILHRSLDLDAAERPATAAEMRQMLREHEQYADLAINTVSVARGDGVDFHSQPTQLMPGRTMGGPLRATNAKTFVDDEGLSHVTAIRPLVQKADTSPDGFAGDGNGKPRRKVLAAGAGALVLIGATIAGVLGYQSAFDDHVSDRDPIPVQVVDTQSSTASEAPAANDEVPALADVAATAANSNVLAQQPRTETPPAPKRSEQARTSKPAANDDSETDVDPDEAVVFKGDDIYVGNMKMKDGKIYMPDGSVYVTPKSPKPPGVHIPPIRLTEEQMQQMTPEQRRKLRAIRQSFPGAFPAITPKPKQ